MKQKVLFTQVIAFLLPAFAFAQTPVGGALNFIDRLTVAVSFVVPVLLSLAIVVFFWGIVKFIARAGDEKGREDAKNVIIWGLVAIFVMVALWGLVGFVQSLFDLSYGNPGDLLLPPARIPG